jgi:hypothetical protein
MNKFSFQPQTAILLVVTALMISGFTGCGGGESGDARIAAVNKDNMERLINLYNRFQMQNKFKGPKDEAEFVEFIDGLSEKTLTRMGIEPGSTKDLLVCERDNQPFKIRYGVRGNSRGSNEAIIFEETGVDGVRIVGFTSMAKEEVDVASRYSDLFSGAVKVESNTAASSIPGNN